VRRATTPLGRSCVTSSASALPGFDSACMKTHGQARAVDRPRHYVEMVASAVFGA
jgi:hypothetical protein